MGNSMSDKSFPEITIKAVILGILLSMILAGANAYLGLFAGMTVSASIPAAVISMGVLRLFRKSNILENNIVQTAASAGESLAAGVIFTIPALVLMGYWSEFNYIEVAKIASIGGVIGVLFTVPLRRALIVEAKLKYPEGIATAAVLKAGDRSSRVKKGNTDTKDESGGLKLIGLAGLVGGIMKLAQQGLQLWPDSINGAVVATFTRASNTLGSSIFGLGTNLSPALISVGYIVGRNIGILVVTGGLISWAIAIPIYTAINGFEGTGYDAAEEIWGAHIRFMGIGAMVVGGIWSIFRLFKPLISGIKASLNSMKQSKEGSTLPREERDFPIKYVFYALIALLIPVFLLYLDIIASVGIAIVLSIVMMLFGFLFSAVAAYMAGVVGSSNNPISGVTIATILFSSLILVALVGTGSIQGAAAAILIGAVVCCAAAIGGDNLQDLKTGHILGATPWKQQVMQVVGVISAAVVLGLVLDILHTAYTIGSPTLSAPQATLMKSVAEGVFQGTLPWTMVSIGAFIGILIILIDIRQERIGSDFRVPVLAVAIGIYLPIGLTVPIFIGGMISHLGNKRGATEITRNRGLLFASGLITGEAIMGILVALPIFISQDRNWWPTISGFNSLGLILFILVCFWLYRTLINVRVAD
jgi:putative OPT family oligopeptide transporter